MVATVVLKLILLISVILVALIVCEIGSCKHTLFEGFYVDATSIV